METEADVRLRRLVQAREQAKGKAADAQGDLYAAMLDAFEAGMGYAQIAEATGLTRDRVAQVLRLERDRRAAA